MIDYYYDEIDDCIIAAYNHVKQTGYKVENYSNNKVVGVWSDDNILFLMTKKHHLESKKKYLATQIVKKGIKIVDFVNKQLMVFL